MAAYRPRYKIDIPSHHPAEDDKLGYISIARAICEMLANTTVENTGLTIGIFGDWGTGKSSVLRMVQDLLESSDEHSEKRDVFEPLVIEFDAWRYLQQENLWLAFLREIVAGVEDNLGLWALTKLNFELWRGRIAKNRNFYDSLKRILGKALFVGVVTGLFVWFFVAVFSDQFEKTITKSLIVIAGGALPLITFIFTNLWKVVVAILQDKIFISLPSLSQRGYDRGQTILVDTFLTDFDALLSYFASQHPLVVLIDDLDRCSPMQIVPVLEAIKFFDSKPVRKLSKKPSFAPITFVLAADRRAIERAVLTQFKDYQADMTPEERNEFAREYIEKIVQVPFHLPPLSQDALGDLLMIAEK